MYRDIPDELRAHMEPVIDEHDCELVDVETVKGKGTSVLRVIVDSKSGDGRIAIDVLARVSREIEAQLDATDSMAGRYRLEVSSPGLDRVLAREKDFEAAKGSQVNLTTRRPLDGRRRFRGTLIDLTEGMIRLEIDGRDLTVPFEAVAKANKIYQFSPADFGSTDPEKRAE